MNKIKERIFTKLQNDFQLEEDSTLSLAEDSRKYCLNQMHSTEAKSLLLSLSTVLCYLNMIKIRADSEGKLKVNKLDLYMDSIEEAQTMLLEIDCFKSYFEDLEVFCVTMRAVDACLKDFKKLLKNLEETSEQAYEGIVKGRKQKVDDDRLREMYQGIAWPIVNGGA